MNYVGVAKDREEGPSYVTVTPNTSAKCTLHRPMWCIVRIEKVSRESLIIIYSFLLGGISVYPMSNKFDGIF
jgi:hypothetical protein